MGAQLADNVVLVYSRGQEGLQDVARREDLGPSHQGLDALGSHGGVANFGLGQEGALGVSLRVLADKLEPASVVESEGIDDDEHDLFGDVGGGV